ncbi:MAG: hypothetical protein COB65_09975 [Thalassobium sp.]|nr:MAG: hypothetical protein COB65_09975 [Thalassobium sp.]
MPFANGVVTNPSWAGKPFGFAPSDVSGLRTELDAFSPPDHPLDSDGNIGNSALKGLCVAIFERIGSQARLIVLHDVQAT